MVTPSFRLCIFLVFVAPSTLLTEDANAQSAFVAPIEAATPLTVVAPKFPENTSAGTAGTRVDVVGTVLATGEFAPISVTAEDGQQQFASAVSEVLRWWQFVPAIDRNLCSPKPVTSQFAVWFEGSDASPKVFFSFPRTNESTHYPSYMPNVSNDPTVQYPRKFRGVEGQVRVLYHVDLQGKIKSLAIRSSTPYGAFDEAVLAAARETTVTWKEPKPTADLCVERTYIFCMERAGDARVKLDQCRKER